MSFDPDALARDALACQATRSAGLVSRVELVPDGLRWQAAPFVAPENAPNGTLLDGLGAAWQRVLDALAFRHERIVNLAYVATTSQAEALERAARTLGLAPSPPLAASTWLALTVKPPAEGAAVEVANGLLVQSVPAGHERPQVFESVQPLLARAEWNEISVLPPRLEPPVLGTDARCGLIGRGGLAVGDRLVISGMVGGKPFAKDVTLTSIDILPTTLEPSSQDARRVAAASGRLGPASEREKKQRTRVGPRQRRLGWGVSLAEPPSAMPIANAIAVELGPSTGLFGADALPWESLPDSDRYAVSEPRGGLRRLARPALDGTGADSPLAAFACLAGEATAVGTSGGAWIAASSRGLFRSTDEGVSWTRTGLRVWSARTICSSDAGLFVGTASHGVIRSVDGGVTWEVLRGGTVVVSDVGGVVIGLGRLPRCSVGSLGVFPSGESSALVLAGTNAGLYYQQIGDPAWYPHADGLPLVGSRSHSGGPAVTAVVLEPESGALLLGTSRGLFRAASLDSAWQPVTSFGEAPAISTLGLDPFGAVLVGLEGGGLYRLASGAVAAVGPDVDNPFAAISVRALAVSADSWWVGTDQGCFWSSDGEGWTRVTAQPVFSLAALADGGVLVAARLDGSVHREWPAFELRPDYLDLDRLCPRAVPGAALVLDASERPLVVTVRRVSEVTLDDFGLRSRVTRLELDPEPRLCAMSRRTTRVLVAVRDLGIVQPELGSAAPAASITLAQLPSTQLLVDGQLPDLSGRAVIVSGPSLRTRLPAGTALVEADSGVSLTLQGDTDATLLSVPVVRGAVTVVRVLTVDGSTGTVSVPVLPLLEGSQAMPLAVLRHVLGVERGPEGTRVTLDAPLALPFDPTRLTLYGNVVAARHGQSVEHEVLGSGEPNRVSQRFKLLQPLCWIPDAAGAVFPALDVQVSGHTWRRVDQRADSMPHERTYTVETSMSGATFVQFGDGSDGARPGAGVENIVASYHSGGGQIGNQPAGVIRLLKDRKPGVKAAFNPLPATGGSDTESLEELRGRIPLHARLPERVVSLPDFVDHLATLGGLAKSLVCHLWNGHAHVVHITLATTDAVNNWALDPSSELAGALHALAAQAPIAFDSVEIAWFSVWMDVAVAPDLDPKVVLAAVEHALTSAFGFDAREIGDGVLASGLVRVAMDVPGVTNAAVRRLGALGEASAPEPTRELPGACARLDAAGGAVLPARLWLIAPPTGAKAAPDSPTCTVVRHMGAP